MIPIKPERGESLGYFFSCFIKKVIECNIFFDWVNKTFLPMWNLRLQIGEYHAKFSDHESNHIFLLLLYSFSHCNKRLAKVKNLDIKWKLLWGQHMEGMSRGTAHDPTSLKDQRGLGPIAADVVLNIGI